MRQHFSNHLNGPVPNGFVPSHESPEKVAEHSHHEAVSDGIFFLIPTFSSNFLVGCSFMELDVIKAQVK